MGLGENEGLDLVACKLFSLPFFPATREPLLTRRAPKSTSIARACKARNRHGDGSDTDDDAKPPSVPSLATALEALLERRIISWCSALGYHPARQRDTIAAWFSDRTKFNHTRLVSPTRPRWHPVTVVTSK